MALALAMPPAETQAQTSTLPVNCTGTRADGTPIPTLGALRAGDTLICTGTLGTITTDVANVTIQLGNGNEGASIADSTLTATVAGGGGSGTITIRGGATNRSSVSLGRIGEERRVVQVTSGGDDVLVTNIGSITANGRGARAIDITSGGGDITISDINSIGGGSLFGMTLNAGSGDITIRDIGSINSGGGGIWIDNASGNVVIENIGRINSGVRAGIHIGGDSSMLNVTIDVGPINTTGVQNTIEITGPSNITLRGLVQNSNNASRGTIVTGNGDDRLTLVDSGWFAHNWEAGNGTDTLNVMRDITFDAALVNRLRNVEVVRFSTGTSTIGSLVFSGRVDVASAAALNFQDSAIAQSTFNISGSVEVVGEAIGSATIGGALTLNAAGRLFIDVGASSADRLNVAGAIHLAGRIVPRVTGTITAGSYVILDGTGFSGTAILDNSQFDNDEFGLSLATNTTNHTITLTIAPLRAGSNNSCIIANRNASDVRNDLVSGDRITCAGRVSRSSTGISLITDEAGITIVLGDETRGATLTGGIVSRVLTSGGHNPGSGDIIIRGASSASPNNIVVETNRFTGDAVFAGDGIYVNSGSNAIRISNIGTVTGSAEGIDASATSSDITIRDINFVTGGTSAIKVSATDGATVSIANVGTLTAMGSGIYQAGISVATTVFAIDVDITDIDTITSTSDRGISLSTRGGDVTIRSVKSLSSSDGVAARIHTGLFTTTAGAVIIDDVDSISSTSGIGIDIDTLGGDVDLTNIDAVTGGTQAIVVESQGGDVTLDDFDSISGSGDQTIFIASAGGDVTLRNIDLIAAMGSSGLAANITATASATITIHDIANVYSAGGGGIRAVGGAGDVTIRDIPSLTAMGGNAIHAVGGGDITISNVPIITNTGGRGIHAESTDAGSVIVTIERVTSSTGIFIDSDSQLAANAATRTYSHRAVVQGSGTSGRQVIASGGTAIDIRTQYARVIVQDLDLVQGTRTDGHGIYVDTRNKGPRSNRPPNTIRKDGSITIEDIGSIDTARWHGIRSYARYTGSDTYVTNIGNVVNTGQHGIHLTTRGDANITVSNVDEISDIGYHGLALVSGFIEQNPKSGDGRQIRISDIDLIARTGRHGIEAMSNSGDITITNVTTIRDVGWWGMSLNSGGGDITITGTDTISTSQVGIYATSGAGDINLDIGDITAGGNFHAIRLITGGSVTANLTADAVVSGRNAGIYIDASGSLEGNTISVLGVAGTSGQRVTTSGSGAAIDITSGGSAISITNIDVIESSGGHGIFAESGNLSNRADGDITIRDATVRGVTHAIQARSSIGAISITNIEARSTNSFAIFAQSYGGEITISDIRPGNGAQANNSIYAAILDNPASRSRLGLTIDASTIDIIAAHTATDAADRIGISVGNAEVGDVLLTVANVTATANHAIAVTAGAPQAPGVTPTFNDGDITINLIPNANISGGNSGIIVDRFTNTGLRNTIRIQGVINDPTPGIDRLIAGRSGQQVITHGTGDAISVDTGINAPITVQNFDRIAALGTAGTAIKADSDGGAVTITNIGNVYSKSGVGINADTNARRSINITNIDVVTGGGGDAINARTGGEGGDITINVGEVRGSVHGIWASSGQQLGTVSITADVVQGGTGAGIASDALKGRVFVNVANVSSTGGHGIDVDTTHGGGAATIITQKVTAGGANHAIFVSGAGGGNVSLRADANISGGDAGIFFGTRTFSTAAGAGRTVRLQGVVENAEGALVAGTSGQQVTTSGTGGAIHIDTSGAHAIVQNLNLVETTGSSGAAIDIFTGSGGGDITITDINTITSMGGRGIRASSGTGAIIIDVNDVTSAAGNTTIQTMGSGDATITLRGRAMAGADLGDIITDSGDDTLILSSANARFHEWNAGSGTDALAVGFDGLRLNQAFISNFPTIGVEQLHLNVGTINADSFAFNGNVVVNTNATLNFNSGATITADNLDVSGHIEIAASNIRTATLAGDLTINAGGELYFDINGTTDTQDTIVVSGAATLNGGTIFIRANGSLAVGDRFVLINGGTALTGTISLDPFSLTSSDYTAVLQYDPTTFDVTLALVDQLPGQLDSCVITTPPMRDLNMLASGDTVTCLGTVRDRLLDTTIGGITIVLGNVDTGTTIERGIRATAAGGGSGPIIVRGASEDRRNDTIVQGIPDAIDITSDGGDIFVTNIGSVLGTGAGGDGIRATSDGGDITITNINSIQATDIAIDANARNANGTATGTITIDVVSIGGFGRGITANTDLGAIDITMSGARIGNRFNDVSAQIFSATSLADITIDTRASDIHSDRIAIAAQHSGSGDIIIDAGNVTAGSTSHAIALQGRGDITANIHTDATISGSDTGIDINATRLLAGKSISVQGVIADSNGNLSAGLSGQQITTTGDVAIHIDSNSAQATVANFARVEARGTAILNVAAIDIVTQGGDVIITDIANISSAHGRSIYVDANGGEITITNIDSVTGNLWAILATNRDANGQGAGAITIDVDNVSAARYGIDVHSDLGAIDITMRGKATTGRYNNIRAQILSSTASADITIDTRASNVVSQTIGVDAQNRGLGGINVTATNVTTTAANQRAINLSGLGDITLNLLADANISGGNGIDIGAVSAPVGAEIIVRGVIADTNGMLVESTSGQRVTGTSSAGAIAAIDIESGRATATVANLALVEAIGGGRGVSISSGGGSDIFITDIANVTSASGHAIAASTNFSGDINITDIALVNSTSGHGIHVDSVAGVTGTVIIDVDRVISGGANSINVSWDGKINLTVAEARNTRGSGASSNAIHVSGGVGAVTIKATSNVYSNNGRGIVATSRSGTIDITANEVTSGAGAHAVHVRGNNHITVNVVADGTFRGRGSSAVGIDIDASNAGAGNLITIQGVVEDMNGVLSVQTSGQTVQGGGPAIHIDTGGANANVMNLATVSSSGSAAIDIASMGGDITIANIDLISGGQRGIELASGSGHITIVDIDRFTSSSTGMYLQGSAVTGDITIRNIDDFTIANDVSGIFLQAFNNINSNITIDNVDFSAASASRAIQVDNEDGTANITLTNIGGSFTTANPSIFVRTSGGANISLADGASVTSTGDRTIQVWNPDLRSASENITINTAGATVTSQSTTDHESAIWVGIDGNSNISITSGRVVSNRVAIRAFINKPGGDVVATPEQAQIFIDTTAGNVSSSAGSGIWVTNAEDGNITIIAGNVSSASGSSTILTTGGGAGYNVPTGTGVSNITIVEGARISGGTRSILTAGGNDIVSIYGIVDGSVETGDGDDRVTLGGRANSVIRTGAGDDRLTITSASAQFDTWMGGSETDTLEIAYDQAQIDQALLDKLVSVEQIELSSGTANFGDFNFGGSISAEAGAAINFVNGATITAASIDVAGNITINEGAVGALDISGTLTIAASAMMFFDIDGLARTNDRINVSGATNIDGTIVVTALSDLSGATEFVLIDSATSLSGNYRLDSSAIVSDVYSVRLYRDDSEFTITLLVDSAVDPIDNACTVTNRPVDLNDMTGPRALARGDSITCLGTIRDRFTNRTAVGGLAITLGNVDAGATLNQGIDITATDGGRGNIRIHGASADRRSDVSISGRPDAIHVSSGGDDVYIANIGSVTGTGTNEQGIDINSDGGTITITNVDLVSGLGQAIHANATIGSGADSGNGMGAVTINVASIGGLSGGIIAASDHGAISITMTDAAVTGGAYSNDINARIANVNAQADITIDTRTSNILRTGGVGILAHNAGSGNVTLTIADVDSGTDSHAVSIRGGSSVTANLFAGADITGRNDGIYINAMSAGAGQTIIVQGVTTDANANIVAGLSGQSISTTGSSAAPSGAAVDINSGGASASIANLATISTSDSSGAGIEIATSGGDITIQDITSISSGDGRGIHADSDGGHITIRNVGAVSGAGTSGSNFARGRAVYADARGVGGITASTGSVTIDVTDVSGTAGGVTALTASGAIDITTSGDRIGTTFNNIQAIISDLNTNATISIDASAANVFGVSTGIDARNYGSGDIRIAAGKVIGSGSGHAIYTQGRGSVTANLSADANISSASAGIEISAIGARAGETIIVQGIVEDVSGNLVAGARRATGLDYRKPQRT